MLDPQKPGTLLLCSDKLTTENSLTAFKALQPGTWGISVRNKHHRKTAEEERQGYEKREP